MANEYKAKFLSDLQNLFGEPRRLSKSLSLFEYSEGQLRVYIRYSKIHSKGQAFYGIRKKDLKYLEGYNSYMCFLWEDFNAPLIIPFDEFEEILDNADVASDGQIKVSVYNSKESTEFYIPDYGRFNVEQFFGFDYLIKQTDVEKIESIPELSHSQVQTLIGYIGYSKGFDIWIPRSDRSKLDWDLIDQYDFKKEISKRYSKVINTVSEIDVIWVKKGTSDLKAMFEVEHSTPVYSGLLRFNDLHLIEPNLKPKFSIVSNYLRKSLFHRQINRPTFQVSGLSELCNFLEYKDVYGWYIRTKNQRK